MDNNYLISAIVPVYNTPAKFLKECINSVENQTYTNYELIIVDDGSNQDCAALCDSFANNNPKIKVIHQENGGVSAARNTGLKHFSGDILTFIDSDDSLVETAWEKAISALKSTNADLVCFGWIDFCEKDTYIQKITDEIKVKSSKEFQVEVGSNNYKCGGGYPWNKLWLVDRIKSKNLPTFDINLDIYEDKLWVLQASEFINNVVLIPDLLYRYRFVSSSLTQQEENRIPRLLVAYDAYKIILDYLESVNEKAYIYAYNFCFEFTNNDIRFLKENKALHKDQIKKSKKALKRLCKRIKPRTLYVPIKSKDFFIWAFYHYLCI